MLLSIFLICCSILVQCDTGSTNVTKLTPNIILEMNSYQTPQYKTSATNTIKKYVCGSDSIYSVFPMKSGKITTITLKLLQSRNRYFAIGFGSFTGKNWVGYDPNTFSWHINYVQMGGSVKCIANSCFSYGNIVGVGDTIKAKLNLLNPAGIVEYFLNGQSQGIAFIGFSKHLY